MDRRGDQGRRARSPFAHRPALTVRLSRSVFRSAPSCGSAVASRTTCCGTLLDRLEAVVDIRELCVTRGGLPRRALAMVLEWAVEHREELLEDWDLCSQLKTPKPISPLE
ncbi:MAG: DUF4160 domain-containing protein [Candidatus Binatia bacterium]